MEEESSSESESEAELWSDSESSEEEKVSLLVAVICFGLRFNLVGTAGVVVVVVVSPSVVATGRFRLLDLRPFLGMLCWN